MKKEEVQNTKVVTRLLGKNFALFREYNLQRLHNMHEDSAEEEEMKRQQRTKVMKDMTKKIRSKGRMDAENRWWVAELLAADCGTAWLHPGEEETMQKWYFWLEAKKKKDEKRKMEKFHQQRMNQMIKSAESSVGLLHKITKPAAWRGGTQILKKEEKDVRLLDSCEAQRKEWVKHWHRNESVQNVEAKSWKTEDLKKVGGGFAKVERV